MRKDEGHPTTRNFSLKALYPALNYPPVDGFYSLDISETEQDQGTGAVSV